MLCYPLTKGPELNSQGMFYISQANVARLHRDYYFPLNEMVSGPH